MVIGRDKKIPVPKLPNKAARRLGGKGDRLSFEKKKKKHRIATDTRRGFLSPGIP